MENKEPPAPKKVSRKMLVILGVCILIWLPFLFTGNNSPTESVKTEKDYSTAAYVQAKAYVKTVLKSPSTADFPYLDFQSRKVGEDKYIVSSYVDSQNSFGAMIRSNWIVTMQYKGESEQLTNEILAKEVGFREFQAINSNFDYHIIFNATLQQEQLKLMDYIKSYK